MENYSGTPIDAMHASQMLDRWSRGGQEIGVIFWGQSANLYTTAVVTSLQKGRLEVKGASVRTTFNLKGVNFKYGPMPMWPNWPSPPIIEVNALRAEFPNGDYLTLAEGLTPAAIPPAPLTELV